MKEDIKIFHKMLTRTLILLKISMKNGVKKEYFIVVILRTDDAAKMDSQ